MSKQPIYTNRLIHQKSPYLLQHAHNPVDWYPWGDEAFQASKEEDKPIFLSIGYSTCHWCHVMEKESFEDEEIAQLMNNTFINIKVDREELPEVDNIYMEFAQSMMAGAAGWPLNVILTPDLQPFFAATYLPPDERHGLMGLSELIMRINEVWEGEEREKVVLQAHKIVEVFYESIHTQGDFLPTKDIIEDSAEMLFKMADPIYGGMKGHPKFPIGYQSNFMLRYSAVTKDSRAVFLVDRTLDMMHRGGIYDHLGGGFSRYSVDEKWLVPHFEKMLYDNAILAFTYLEAWLSTKKPLYKRVCEEILDYVLRDMTHSMGGFYSAEDADSEGHEGYFYTWEYQQIRNLLKDDGDDFCAFFNITPEGNFEGRNILNSPMSIEEFSAKHGMDTRELEEKLHRQKKLLWKAREMRIHPLKDDKILTSWNGLMIFALAEAGCAFDNQSYIEAAKKAANFIHRHLWKEGQLYRRWRENESSFKAGLDEYAFLIKGLLSLFQADEGVEWLSWAIELNQILSNKFKADEGAFFQTDGVDVNIILRRCQFSDGAEPSGNSIECENLLKLYQITNESVYLLEAEDVFRAAKRYIDNYPPGYCYHLINLNSYYDSHAPAIVVSLNEEGEYYQEIKRIIFESYIPHKTVIWRREDDHELFQKIPFLKHQPTQEGKTTVYICHEGVCKKPLTDLQEIKEALKKL